jgi:hypothetical protein
MPNSPASTRENTHRESIFTPRNLIKLRETIDYLFSNYLFPNYQTYLIWEIERV